MSSKFLNWLAIVAALAAGPIITTLLSPPPVRAQFSAQALYVPAANVGGTVNAITLTIPNVVAMTDILGVPIRFVPSGASTNTVTINVSSLGLQALQRQTPTGLFALSNGELQTQLATIIWNGANFELTNTAGQPPIGTAITVHSSTIPAGYLVSDGSCFSRTGQYAPLFSVISTTYNSNAPSACSGSQFAVPYANGTLLATQDNQGANTASKITNSGTGNNCNGQTLGNLCGSQNHTLTTAELAVHNHGVTDPGHNHTYTQVQVGAVTFNQGSGVQFVNTTVNTGNATTGVTVNNTGSGNAHSILPPVMIVQHAIKY